MPIGTIATVLTSVKAATEIAKLIKDSATSLEEAEIKLKFAELISALADVKIEIAEVQEMIVVKDNEIKELKLRQKLKASIIFENRCYFTMDDGKKTGPFCQSCYDNDGKLVRLQDNHRGSFSGIVGADWFDCKICKATYDQ
jgi:hypothetical protein